MIRLSFFCINTILGRILLLGMEKIIDKYYDYILYQKENDLILSVVCGTVAVYDITIALNPQETQEYHKKGGSFLDTLASTIRSYPEEYFKRRI